MPTYVVKILRITRGQIRTDMVYPARETGRYTRRKLANGQGRAQRNSEFEYIVKHFETEAITYHEYDNYYIFIVEDEEGILYESHIFVETIDA